MIFKLLLLLSLLIVMDVISYLLELQNKVSGVVNVDYVFIQDV